MRIYHVPDGGVQMNGVIPGAQHDNACHSIHQFDRNYNKPHETFAYEELLENLYTHRAFLHTAWVLGVLPYHALTALR